MIYLLEVESFPETKTVIKRRSPGVGDHLGGMTLYTVHTEAGVQLEDFNALAGARRLCRNADRVRLIEALMIINRLLGIYWSGNHTLKNDEFAHQAEADVEKTRAYLRKDN